jgi:hypothetical protein
MAESNLAMTLGGWGRMRRAGCVLPVGWVRPSHFWLAAIRILPNGGWVAAARRRERTGTANYTCYYDRRNLSTESSRSRVVFSTFLPWTTGRWWWTGFRSVAPHPVGPPAVNVCGGLSCCGHTSCVVGFYRRVCRRSERAESSSWQKSCSGRGNTLVMENAMPDDLGI